MRNAMFSSVSELITNNEDTALFLVDIGVWKFHKLLEKFPQRAKNIGIFEDGMVGVAAGLSLSGITPTIYGITPFIVERALEQLKLDFVYQGIGGNFITTGASYDFSTLGYSHFCPEDVQVLKSLPGFEIIAPGTADEFTTLFNASCLDGRPTYYRLSDYVNSVSQPVEFGKATVVQEGSKATVIAVSTMLGAVLDACTGQDVTILYYTTLSPFDSETLRSHCASGKILLCEPFFEGTLMCDVIKALPGQALTIETAGLPREIYRNYGKKAEKDELYGQTSAGVREKLEKLING